MPRRAAQTQGIYRRGSLWLDWDRRANGALRSPNLAIFWYDGERGRIRSATTGTGDVQAAKQALDARYLVTTRGDAVCPTCGQVRQAARGHLVVTAIANYQATRGDAATRRRRRRRSGRVLPMSSTISRRCRPRRSVARTSTSHGSPASAGGWSANRSSVPPECTGSGASVLSKTA